MELKNVQQLAETLMKEHGILGQWSFRFDGAKRRAGMCSYKHNTIQLSRHFASMNDEAVIRNTILHEIAHALVGPGHGHDWKWKFTARDIGCTGDRCIRDVVQPAGPYIAACCHITYGYRRPKYLGVKGVYFCRKCGKNVVWEHNRGQHADRSH